MKIGYWVVLLLVIGSCKQEEKNENLLSKVEMAAVMLDLHEAEILTNINRSDLLNPELYPLLKQQVIEKHHLTDSLLTLNLQYYLAHPKLIDEIYDIMIDTVKLRQQSIYPEIPHDSIQRDEVKN